MAQNAATNTEHTLSSIEQAIVHREVCPELAAGATQLVFGEGNPDADVVFVGEAPGKKEDEAGRPFVGAAGKFLDELLEIINLDRNDVYITNIVKYRPPNNRDPSPEEKKAFLPFLSQQVQAIKPKLLVTLGRHSMECFLPGMRISNVHGQPKRIKLQFDDNTPPISVVILPLYHPAAALYNGGLRSTLQEDFEAIPEIIKKLKSNE